MLNEQQVKEWAVFAYRRSSRPWRVRDGGPGQEFCWRWSAMACRLMYETANRC